MTAPSQQNGESSARIRWIGPALLVAVFPANIHMALNPDAYVESGTSLAFIYGRLPFQFLFMYWAWWATRPDEPSN